MFKTIRHFWGPQQGRTTLNFNWDVIDHDSVIFISASEYNSDWVRFIGEASITVSNIAPHGPPFDPNHGVTFVVNVGWGSPLNIVTDITVLDAKPAEIRTWIPPRPTSVGLRMQYQESVQWCWIAVATSVNHFYNPSSNWTQCMAMTNIGQNINGYPANTGACPSAQALVNDPNLAAALANPYVPAARHVLDTLPAGVDVRYLKSGSVADPLKLMGNWASDQPATLSLQQVAAEIGARRPVVASIAWNSGNQHVVAIAGVLGDSLLVIDPENGASVIRFGAFPQRYFGGATIVEYCFTKP
jgi:hypothetical protein